MRKKSNCNSIKKILSGNTSINIDSINLKCSLFILIYYFNITRYKRWECSNIKYFKIIKLIQYSNYTNKILNVFLIDYKCKIAYTKINKSLPSDLCENIFSYISYNKK